MSPRPLTTTSLVLAAAALLANLAPSALAYQRPGSVQRVTVSADGGDTDAVSYSASLSGDGRAVAFSSLAGNLAPGDTNEAEDVFVRDLVAGKTVRVSVASDGTQADDLSYHAAMSADGRYVAFTSLAGNLVPDDTNEKRDVFVHDLVIGQTERVSVTSSEVQGNDRSFDPAVSADGRFVAFESAATNLVPGDAANDCTFGCDVFVRDRAAGTTERVSLAGDGTKPNARAGSPDISADGRYVVFTSRASNLVAGDLNTYDDIFVRDRRTGNTERVSVASDGSEGVFGSLRARISADGRYVVFSSASTNLAPADTNRADDVFVHDRVTRKTERVSVASTGAEGNASSPIPGGISDDGRYVLFGSAASNLVAGDTNAVSDVFAHDRLTRSTERVSAGSDGSETDDHSSAVDLSGDGRLVLFDSAASNLVSGDENFTADTFLRDRGPAVGIGGLEASISGGSVSVSGWAAFPATVAVRAPDPLDGSPGVREAGGEITAASVVQRPEEGDLLWRLDLASLPGVRQPSRSGTLFPVIAGGAPAILYGLEVGVGAVRYEVRAIRAGATASPPSAPLFALYRCDPTCAETARLSGGLGTTADEVLVSIPLSALGAAPGVVLTGVRAYTAVGEAGPGPAARLDQVNLGDVPLAVPTVQVGMAPAGRPESDVDFGTVAGLANGFFTATLDGPAAGDHDVWARACLGDPCGAARIPLE